MAKIKNPEGGKSWGMCQSIKTLLEEEGVLNSRPQVREKYLHAN